MDNHRLQLDLKDLTREEFKNIMLPDSYVFIHIDFDTQPDRVDQSEGEFRLFYGHWNSNPARLGFRGPRDIEAFEQAYLFIGDHLERLNYGRKVDEKPHSLGDKLSRKFILDGVLFKHDLTHIVEEVLGNGFTNVRIPYLSVNTVRLEDADKYGFPFSKITTYFETEE